MVLLRPVYLPACFAFAIPSNCRSRIVARPNSATPHMIVNISFDIAESSPVKISDSFYELHDDAPPVQRLDCMDHTQG
jgi:hypothetical protein